MISRIALIQFGGADLFASVKGFSTNTVREIVVAMRREIKPAAFVVYVGRGASTAWGIPDEPAFCVFAIAESLRGGSEPRTGSSLAAGGFDLLAGIFSALAGQMILADRIPAFVDERVIASDETSIVYEQRYNIMRPATTTPPTFGGLALCGADSVVVLEVGESTAEDQRFAFPGIDGEFRMLLGVRARSIVCEGQLRAAADAQLGDIETDLEQLIAGGLPNVLIDGHGCSFENCAVQRLVRSGPRRKQAITGQVLQDFKLYFVQLMY